MPQDMQENNIVLSISLLTSNRKDTIRKCLDSLAALRRQVSSELILVDTGCDAEMLQIIRPYTDQIVHFTWCNDFAKARNAGLEKAKGEWFLFIDDDEWFEDTAEIVAFFQDGAYKNYAAAQYIVRNYGNMQGTFYEDVSVIRMAKITENVRFQGRIHEELCLCDGPIKYINDYVHHFGYVFSSEKEKYLHYQRNETLLKMMLKNDRNNVRWWVHLAQEYWLVAERQKLLELCQDAIDMIQSWTYLDPGNARGSFYVGRILAAQRLYWYEDAIGYLKEALLDQKNNQMCLAKLFSIGTELYYEVEDYIHCIECARCYLVCYEEKQPDFQKEAAVFTNDAYSQKTYSSVISLILDVAVKTKDVDVIKEYFPQLEWGQNQVIVYNTSLFSMLIDFMADHPYDSFFVFIAQTFMDRASFDAGFKEVVIRELRRLEKEEQEVVFRRIVKIFSQVASEEPYMDYIKIRAVGMGYDIGAVPLLGCYQRLMKKSDNIFQMDRLVWEIAKANQIDVEGLFLSMNFPVWGKHVDDFCANTALEKVDYYVDFIKQFSEQENIRFQYFFLKASEAMLFYGAGRESYLALHEQIQTFVDLHLAFYLQYYSEKAFEGEMELLPDACKAALFLKEALSAEKAGDYRTVLLILKECIGIHARLDETIQVYSHYYVEELQRHI